MCNCIKESESNIAIKMQEKLSTIKNVTEAEEPEFDNKALMVKDSKSRTAIYSTITGKYYQGKASRKFSVNMYFTYCPFCGVKY